MLRLSDCIDEFYLNSDQLPGDIFEKIYQTPNIVLQDYKYVEYMKPELKTYTCDWQTMIDIYVNVIRFFLILKILNQFN